MNMPDHVKSSLQAMLEGVSRKDLAARAALLTDTYRNAGSSSAAVKDRQDALAYAVARMPATYAATVEALGRAAQRLPGLQPRTVLDLGSGPGTASLAALGMWPAIERVTMLEGLPEFRDLAAKLLHAGNVPGSTGATVVDADLRAGAKAWPETDLVMAAYVMVELSEAQARALARDAFSRARQALILVEPGTPAGFARIRMARAALIELGAMPVAPCPHALACPMLSPDWCHFSVRLARSRDHKLAKAADAPFEDEKFSYLAVSRLPPAAVGAERVIAPIRVSKAEVALRACASDGIVERRISRRARLDYKAAKRLGWGDLVSHNANSLSEAP